MIESPFKTSRQFRIRAVSILTFFLLVLLGLSSLWFPIPTTGVTLDESWERSIAFFAKQHMEAGTEFVFTYGPLGYLVTPVFDPDLFWNSYWFQIISKALLIFYLWRLSTPHSLLKAAGILLLVIYFPMVHIDAKLFFLVTLAAIDLNENGPPGPRRLFDVAFLSILSLGKFTYFVFSLLIVFISEFRIRRENLKTFFSPVLIFAVVVCLEWILTGHSLGGIARFIYSSMQITGGYDDAMAIYGNQSLLFISLVILFLVLTLLFDLFLRFRKDTRIPIQLAIIGLGVVIAWKQGFVRQDPHMLVFFGYALFITTFFLLHFLDGESEFARTILRIGAIVIVVSLCGYAIPVVGVENVGAGPGLKGMVTRLNFVIQRNGDFLLHPNRALSVLNNKERKLEQAFSLPSVKAHVGNASIDIFSYQQNFVILNHLNWTTRPVFQSYSAYTPYLSEMNLQFFRKKPPAFLLYKQQTIDGRFPTLDDNLTLFEVLSNYKPVAAERGFLLLEKTSSQRQPLRTVRTAEIRFNQEVQIDPSFHYQVLYLKIKEKFSEKIRKILYKPSLVSIVIRTEAGKTLPYKLIPSIAQQGFLLTPLLQETSDVAEVYTGGRGTAVKSFSVWTDSPGSFGKSIEMELKTLPGFQSIPLNSDRQRLLFDALEFETAYDPNKQISFLNLNGGQVLDNGCHVLYTNNSLETSAIKLPAGKYRIGLFGYGTPAGGIFPSVSISWNGKKISDFFLSAKGEYQIPFELHQQEEGKISLTFTNDAMIGKEDRNVFIKDVHISQL